MSGINARKREEELEERVILLELALSELIDGESEYDLVGITGLSIERCKEIIDLLGNRKDI